MENALKGKQEVGKVAKCQHGKVGVITAYSSYGGRSIYYGIDFDGKHWQSIKPEILSNSINKFWNKGK